MTRPKLKRAAIASLLLLAAIAALSPWWTRWAAAAAARSQGVEIARIVSIGDGRWRAEGIAADFPGLSIKAKSIELPTALRWAGAYLSGSAPAGLALNDWTVEILPASPAETTAAPAPSLSKILAQAEQALDAIERYAGPIQTRDGAITVEGQTYLIPQADFSERSLTLQASQPDRGLVLEAKLSQNPEKAWTIALSEASRDLALNAELNGNALQGSATFQGHPIELEARWHPDQLIPDSAALRVQGLPLHQAVPNWPKNAPLAVDAQVRWIEKQLRFDAAGAAPEGSPPQSIAISGSGDLASIQLDALAVEIPGATLTLSSPAQLQLATGKLSNQTTLAARVDLARIPGSGAAGLFEGEIALSPSSKPWPHAAATLAAQAPSFGKVALASATVQAELDYPELSLTQAKIEAAAGSFATVSGSLDLSTLQIAAAEIALEDDGSLLPALGIAPFAYAGAQARFSLTGPVLAPKADGTLSLSAVQAKGLKPFDAEISLSNASDPLSLSAALRSAGSRLDIAALLSVEQTPAGAALAFSNIDLRQGDALLVHIPAVETKPGRLAFNAEIDSLSLGFLSGFLAEPLPEIQLSNCVFDFEATPEAAHFSTFGQASYRVADSAPIAARWSLRQDASQLVIDGIEATFEDTPVLNIKGQLPIRANPLAETFLAIDSQSPVSLEAASVPNPQFWDSVSQWLPLTFQRPSIQISLQGPLDEIAGSIQARFPLLAYAVAPNRAVDLHDFQLAATIKSGAFSLDQASGRVGGNRVSLSAQLPASAKTIEAWIQSRSLPDLAGLAAQAEIHADDLAAFAPWLPEIIRHEGSFQTRLTVEPGLKIFGEASLSNLATRPLEPLGALSEISGKVRFEGKRLDGIALTAKSDQGRFSLNGAADFADLSQPKYDLKLAAADIPLIRATDVSLNGDLALALKTEANKPPELSGSIDLKKGLLLIQPDFFAASAKTVAQTPPYFSVSQEPFNAWGLDLKIKGQEFLRVSNSLFQGMLSFDLSLEGNLGAPLLLGRATIDQGKIFFPAASFRIDQGSAYFTRENPKEINLDITARSRTYGYDVQLGVDGFASDPQLTVTTNPALRPTDALLLVTTGAVPGQSNNLGRQSAASLGMFLGKGLFGKLVPSGGDGAEKLTLEIGQDITQQGKKTIEARYQLKEDLEIVGEYDKRDEYNANILWTLIKK